MPQLSSPDTENPLTAELDALLGDVYSLVSPPEVYFRLESMIDSPNAKWHDLADVIAQDPNMSARLLRLANSAFHGKRNIDTLSRAVALIGTRALYDLAVGVAALSVFQKVPAELLNVSVFWRHSLCTGIIAKLLARQCNVLHPERLFVAGLLHDVGSLVIAMRRPDQAREALLVAQGDEDLVAVKERELLGFDHAEVGARLMELWQLPEGTTQAIRYHHRLAEAEEPTLEVALVHIANGLANRMEEGAFSLEGSLAAHIDPAAWGLSGLSEDIAESVWADVYGELSHAVDVLYCDAR
jgi:putative nucleotidyltransferase with HDIG domain